ncbi:MAG: PAS domain S-box protein [Trichodesmium sp.]
MSMLPHKKLNNLPSLPDSDLWVGGILNELEAGILSIDAQNSQLLYINQAVENIYGRQINEFYEHHNLWLEVIEPSQKNRVENCLAEVKKTGKSQIEYQIILPNGTTRLVRHQLVYVENKNQETKYINSIITDITKVQDLNSQLLETEQKLDNETQKFQKLTNNIPGVIYQWKKEQDGSDKFLYMSHSCQEIFELEPADVQANSTLIWNLIHPDDVESFWKSVAIAAETLNNWEFKWRIITKSGIVKWVSAIAQPEQESNGEIVWCGMLLDISDRKQIETEKTRLITSLAESEAQYRYVLSALADGVIVQDTQGIILTSNDSAENILGLTTEQIIGQTPLDFCWQAVKEDGSLLLSEQHPNSITLNTGKACYNYIMGIYQSDSSLRWICVNTIPLFRKHQPTPYASVASITDITEQRLAEAALRESEARNRAFVEAIPDILFRLSRDGKYIDFKASNENDLAVPPSAIIGKNIKELLSIELAQEFWHNVERAIFTGKLQICEYQLTTIAGKNQDFEARFVKVGDSEEVLVIVRNITEHKQAELSLRESERRFRAVFNSMFQFMGFLKPDGTVLQVNQTYLDFFDIQEVEVVGRYFWEIPGWLPETMNQIQESIKQSRTGEVVRYEIDLVNTNGKTFTIDFSLKPVVNETGTVELLIAEGRDISDRKKAELERDRFFTVSLDLLCIGGFDGYFKRINPAWSNLFGYTQEELLSTPYLKLVHPEDRAATIKVFKNNVAGKVVVGFENRCRTKDGSYKWLSWNMVPFPEDKLIYAIARDISESKTAEVELRETTKKLHEAQRIAHIGSWEFDVINQKITWSDEVFRIYGLNPQEPEPTLPELLQMIHPEDQELHQKAVTQLLEGQPCNFDYRLICPNGDIRHIHSRGEAVHNQQGEVVQFLGMVMDITERKQVEETLQQQEEFLRTIYDGLEQVIFVVDVCADGKFRYAGWNSAGERMIDISSTEGLGKTSVDIFGHELGAEMEERCVKCVRLGISLTFEENLSFNGSENWSLTVLTPLRNTQGQIYRLVGMIYDITERKRTELALQCSEIKFRELAAWERLMNRIGSMIRNSLEIDTILENTVAEIYNHMQVQLCCFSWHQADKTPFWEVVKEAKDGDIQSCLGNSYAEIYNLLSPKILNLEICQIDNISSIKDANFQQFIKQKNIASILSIPLKTRSNQIGALTCYRYTVAQPWTELEVKLLQAVSDQLAIALNQAELYQQSCASAKYANLKNEELKQTLSKLKQTQSQLIQAEKMSSLGQLVAGIAHEINNPVNFIFGNLTYAHDYISDIVGLIKLYQQTYPEPTAEIADEIENIELDFIVEDVMKLLNSMQIGAERIREIVKSLRTFSRLDEAEVKAVDIHENIDSTLMILQSRLKAKNNSSAIDVIKNYGKLPFVECYSGQLNQVFMNIIANGIDALEDREKRLTKTEIKANPSQIIISTTINQTNQLQIRIADNGLGMNQNIVDKIFDPFYTTKPIGKGTGLGLSISYQIIVEKHHGQLHCISELGKGTEFMIEIPLKQLD